MRPKSGTRHYRRFQRYQARRLTGICQTPEFPPHTWRPFRIRRFFSGTAVSGTVKKAPCNKALPFRPVRKSTRDIYRCHGCSLHSDKSSFPLEPATAGRPYSVFNMWESFKSSSSQTERSGALYFSNGYGISRESYFSVPIRL